VIFVDLLGHVFHCLASTAIAIIAIIAVVIKMSPLNYAITLLFLLLHLKLVKPQVFGNAAQAPLYAEQIITAHNSTGCQQTVRLKNP
jgi:hypothetical protein